MSSLFPSSSHFYIPLSCTSLGFFPALTRGPVVPTLPAPFLPPTVLTHPYSTGLPFHFLCVCLSHALCDSILGEPGPEGEIPDPSHCHILTSMTQPPFQVFCMSGRCRACPLIVAPFFGHDWLLTVGSLLRLRAVIPATGPSHGTSPTPSCPSVVVAAIYIKRLTAEPSRSWRKQRHSRMLCLRVGSPVK